MKELEKKLGYSFNNHKILEEALTHRSLNKTVHKQSFSNERLEFLGDKILGFVISEMIYDLYEYKNEGYLSKSFSYFTSSDVLYNIAKNFDLYKYLKHDTDENKRILVNTIESIIAAIYLDCKNIDIVRSFIKKHWKNIIYSYTEDKIYNIFNPKSFLQNWAQQNQLGIPKYKDLLKSGSEHEPLFQVQVEVSNSNYLPCIGQGTSKKNAQKDAAKKFITTHSLK